MLEFPTIDFTVRLCWHPRMADRFINWPPPPEALVPLARAIARAMAEADFKREQEFVRKGRHLRRSFSPVDPESEGE
jgi:hypothetical protein